MGIIDVNIDDLLGRDLINIKEAADYLQNETVLVTGGGGSIGSELCRQILKSKPKILIIFDFYENNAYDLENELQHSYKENSRIKVIIGSIRDKRRVEQVFKEYMPSIVFHAAAYKHVPLMEENSAEALKNNVFGTLNVVECADLYKCKKFILISTDKAVNPTSIMGATKRIAEITIKYMNEKSSTIFAAVRFGNVLGSNGSVIPLFKKQIENGGPITVTHPDIVRYFMTIKEAASLVIQAGAMAVGGEIFVLDMGEPVRIMDLAKSLILLSGFESEVDIGIEIIGLRPGEKLSEELLFNGDGVIVTKNNKIFIEKSQIEEYDKLMSEIKLNRDKEFLNDEDVENFIKKVIKDFKKYKAQNDNAVT